MYIHRGASGWVLYSRESEYGLFLAPDWNSPRLISDSRGSRESALVY